MPKRELVKARSPGGAGRGAADIGPRRQGWGVQADVRRVHGRAAAGRAHAAPLPVRLTGGVRLVTFSGVDAGGTVRADDGA